MSTIKNEIDSDFIFGTIKFDSSTHSKPYVLVEGSSDEIFYSKFFRNDEIEFQNCFGKENLLDAIDKVNKTPDLKDRVIGIADKDFDFLETPISTENLVYTDCHDLEMMCIVSQGFENFVREYFSVSKLKSSGFDNANSLREYILELASHLSRLKIVSKQEELNLAFKASGERKKELPYEKFICKKDFIYLGDRELIKAVKQYYNQALSLNTIDVIGLMKNLDIDSHPICDIVNGHDFSKILVIGLNKKLGTSKFKNCSTDEVERAIRLTFSILDFNKTRMRVRIDELLGVGFLKEI